MHVKSKYLKLEKLNFLPDLSHRHDIEILDISDGNITTISGNFLPKYLKHLKASNNKIKHIYSLPLTLETIDITGNPKSNDGVIMISEDVQIIDDNTINFVEEVDIVLDNIVLDATDDTNNQFDVNTLVTPSNVPNVSKVLNVSKLYKGIPQEWASMVHIEIIYAECCTFPKITKEQFPANLKKLTLCNCSIEEIIDLPMRLEYLNLEKNYIKEIYLAQYLELKEVNLYDNELEIFTFPPFIKTFNIAKNKIITISGMYVPDSLTEFICRDNKITVFPTEDFKKLTELNIKNNDLETLQLPPFIQICKASFNRLTTFPNLPLSLTHLNIEGNHIVSVPRENFSIVFLNCSLNELTNAINFQKWDALKILDISHNKKITSFYATDFPKQIKRINAKKCSLTLFSCESTKLTHVDVSKNIDLKSIRLEKCRNLDYIDVSSTGVTTLYNLPFGKITIKAEDCYNIDGVNACQIIDEYTPNRLTLTENVVPSFNLSEGYSDADTDSVESIESDGSWSNDKYVWGNKTHNSYNSGYKSYNTAYNTTYTSTTRRHVIV